MHFNLFHLPQLVYIIQLLFAYFNLQIFTFPFNQRTFTNMQRADPPSKESYRVKDQETEKAAKAQQRAVEP
jgi:hypothetical protein